MAPRQSLQLGALLFLIAATRFVGSISAATVNVDCSAGGMIAKAIANAKPGDIIRVAGTCKEAVTIMTDRITLDGQGSAILDGGQVGPEGAVAYAEDFLPFFYGMVTIVGARGVTITGFTVQHGPADGITCKGGATCRIHNTTLQDNADEGVQVSQNSTAEIVNCTAQRNGEWGILAFDNSSVVFGAVVANGNGRSGIEIFGASSAAIYGDVTIQAHNNVRHGIEVDAVSNLTALRGTINTEKNGGDGIYVGAGSGLHDFGATFIAKHNKRSGLRIENGSGVIINKSIVTDNGTDVVLRFGGRATLNGNNIGTISCDNGSMIRGDVACPK